MKTKVKTTTVVTELFEYDHGDYVCHETVVNGKIADQYWKPARPTEETHPFGYEPHRLQFRYYDIDLDKVSTKDRDYPEPQFVDAESFSSYDKLIAYWLGTDSFIYSIDYKYPICPWRYAHYIGGVCNDRYKLSEAQIALAKLPWVRNIELVDIPYYNRDENHTRAVQFEFKLPREAMEKYCEEHSTYPRFEFYSREDVLLFGDLLTSMRKKHR